MVSENFTLPSPPIGVIESLTSGFDTVVNRLYLILIPVAVDIVLWLGPRISYKQALGVFGTPDLAAQFSQGFQRLLFPVSPEQYFHPMSAPQYMPALALPSVLNSRDAAQLPFGLNPPIWNIPNLHGMMLLFLGALQIGLIVLIPYLGLIAQAVNNNQTGWRNLVRRSLLIIGQILAIEGVLAVPLLLCLLLSFTGTLAGAPADPGQVSWLIIPTLMFASLWLTISVLLSFTIHSMLLNDRNILGSMWDSMRVVQWNMPATLALLILVSVIFLGMQVVWRLADPGSWITLAAIGGNAFISTGLAAATFVFFKDRYRYWSEFREQLIAELERRRIGQDQHQNKN